MNERAGPWLSMLVLLACRPSQAPTAAPKAPGVTTLELPLAEPEAIKAAAAPSCEPRQLLLRLPRCRFADCKAGQFENPGGWLVDCERPLNDQVSFAANDAALSLKGARTSGLDAVVAGG